MTEVIKITFLVDVSIINYNQIIVLEVSNVSEMLKKWCNLAIIIVARKHAPKHSQLSKAISDLS